MKEVEYRDFSLRLHNKAVWQNKRIPVNATLELTHRCNNRCVHCYCNLPAGDEGAQAGELTRDEIETVFDELQEMGCLWLLITGGEPLLRPDFPEIYLSAKKHGFIVSVFTNGVFVSEEIADLFEKCPPFTVEVTMYGGTPETYERVTRVPGSYELYWTGLQRLLERKVQVKLKTMALTVNQHEIQHMNEIAKKLGCEFRFDPVLNKRIDGKKYSDPVTYRISPDDVVRLDMESPERFDAYQEFCKRTGDQMIRSNKLILCGAGRSSLHITPEGTVLPCSMLMNAGVSVREKPLKEIWEIHFQEILDMERDFKLVCDSCTLHTVCDQCLGWSFVEYGIINKHVEYLCDIMKMRASSFPFLKRNEVNA